MGQDKALIPIDGIPLLLRVCQVAQQCTDQVYVVTPWIERYQELLKSEPTHPPIQLIQESPLIQEPPAAPAAPHGPLIGFLQGLTQVLGQPQAKSDWVMLLACDLPNLQADTLQDWITQLPQVSDETIALLPRNLEGWWEPLCGFYRVDCRSSLEAFVQAGGRSFQHWLAAQRVQVLSADPQMLLNCNTPEDLRRVIGE
jgi:molybdopterin-guanine dinucleotide biosynthesis protein A